MSDLYPRKEPPTVDEVEDCQWWWNFPKDTPPHVMQLDVADGKIVHAQDNGGLFDPTDWPGDWAPCVPPEGRQDVLCNLCGFTCMLRGEQLGGLIKETVVGGYFSTPGNGGGALDDLRAHTFSLCEFCLDWLFAQFAIRVNFAEEMICGGRHEVGEVWRPAAERVASDEWRRMKEEFTAESARRAAAREKRA